MKQNSRNDILNSALDLFAQKGYEAVSPNDICEGAGIQKPTLYHFFGNKEGLLDQLLKEQYSQLDDAISEVCVYLPDPQNYQNDVKPVLVQVCERFFLFVQGNPKFYLLLLSLGFAPPQSVSAMVSEKYHVCHYQIITKLFGDFSAVHTNMSGRESAYAIQFLALINAQIGLWYRGYADISAQDAKHIVRTFLHGIFNK